MNKAQRLWLAGALPLLVLIPFWWEPDHLDYSFATRPYLATLSTIITAWAVLSLIGHRPWQRVPLRTRIFITPPLGLILTLAVIILAQRQRIGTWQPAGWGAAFAVAAFGVFWLLRTFGDRPPTLRAQIITYGGIGFVSTVALFDENFMWGAFDPTLLPHWFATLVLLTGVMLWLLRTPKVRREPVVIDMTEDVREENSAPDQLADQGRIK